LTARRIVLIGSGHRALCRYIAGVTADKPLMTVGEMADLLGCSSNAVRTRLCRDQFPHELIHRIGRSVYFRRTAVLEWLEGHRRG